MNKIIIASDSFKGSLTSEQVAEAVSLGIHDVFPDCRTVKVRVADGGEGTMEAICSSSGYRTEEVLTTDPLGRPIKALYRTYTNTNAIKTAFIEIAQASGLTLLSQNERNPLLTSTYGTGILIRDAFAKGCRKFLIGVGGSATNDGGSGMMEALGVIFHDRKGNKVNKCSGSRLKDISVIDDSGVDPALISSEFIAICDVDTPFYGPDGATMIFAGQKGADKDESRLLEEGMMSYHDVIWKNYGIFLNDIPGSGAAGGTAGALHSFLGAEIRRGADLVLDYISFDTTIKEADLIITGEGRIDNQTLKGKLPYAVLKRAKNSGIPVIAIGGSIELSENDKSDLGFEAILAIGPKPHTESELAEAMKAENAARNIRMCIKEFISKSKGIDEKNP